MKVSPILSFNPAQSNLQVKQNKPLANFTYSDSFVKNSEVSFQANQKSEKIKTNIVDALETIGIVGTPLLLGLGIASLLPQNEDSKDIFLNDGTYFMNTDEMSVNSSHIKADADDGIFTFKGTGIDIRPERFDYIDPENGIYRNFKDKIDIDLLNNKYIDPENGIFIDPLNKISAITIDGQLTNVAIPDISFGTRVMVYEGGRNNTGGGNFEREKISREDFIEKFNEAPEDSRIAGYKISPNDNRTTIEKMKDFITGDKSEVESDIFGRKILTMQDAGGQIHKLTISDEMEKIIDKFNLDDKTLHTVVDYVHKVDLKNYMTESFPDFKVPAVSMSDFLEKIRSASEDIDIPETPEVIDIDTDSHDGFGELFESIFGK